MEKTTSHISDSLHPAERHPQDKTINLLLPSAILLPMATENVLDGSEHTHVLGQLLLPTSYKMHGSGCQRPQAWTRGKPETGEKSKIQ